MAVHLNIDKELEHFIKAEPEGQYLLYRHSLERYNIVQEIWKRQEKEIRKLKNELEAKQKPKKSVKFL